MSCVPCLECGDGAGLTRENLDRWTDSISNVLASSEGRHHFKRYLESRSLDESLNAIEFWEHCTKILSRIPHGGDSPPHVASASESSLQSERSGASFSGGDKASGSQLFEHVSISHSPRVAGDLKKDLQLLVDYADNYVNLDLAQLRCLYQMLRMTEVNAINETLTQAKQAAMDLLQNDYQLFREHLLESRGLLH